MADLRTRYLGMDLRSPLEQLRGRLSQRSVPDPAAFERSNYIATLASRA